MSKLIPVEHAEFFYNRDVTTPPEDFVVVDQRTRERPGQQTLSDPYRHLSASGGAHVADWMDGSDLPGSCPEAVFAQLWLDTGADRGQIKDGLAELAKIKECDWARKMLATLKWIDVNWSK